MSQRPSDRGDRGSLTVSDTDSKAKAGDTDPKLRHEFVGMMFAITVGEIGLQAAALVQAEHYRHYMPAYSHLFLATFVVAASWVGWSKSVIPGAREDVEEVFQWAFIVLLLDMAMVVTYFILVRTVDFGDEHHRIDSASAVAFWHVVIFALYFAWDVVTKVLMYERPGDVGWWRGWKALDAGRKKKRTERFSRIVPTVICLGISLYLWRAFNYATDERLLTADFALLCVVLLFRALKSLQAAISWRAGEKAQESRRRLGFRIVCAATCLVGFLVGLRMTVSSRPLPHLGLGIVQAIHTPVPEQKP
jgi:hypothetical protein